MVAADWLKQGMVAADWLKHLMVAADWLQQWMVVAAAGFVCRFQKQQRLLGALIKKVNNLKFVAVYSEK